MVHCSPCAESGEELVVLSLVLAVSLALEPAALSVNGASPSPGEETTEAAQASTKGTHSAQARRYLKSLVFGASTLVLGSGAALGSWFDRDGVFGRVCAVSAGAIGVGLLAAGVASLITRLINDAKPDDDSSVAQGIVGLITGVVGMVAGGLVSGFASTPAGTPRGVVGIVGGSLLAVTGTTVMIASWESRW
jgi:hypothetical protein